MSEVKGKILAVSGPREFEGTMQIGFTLAENNSKWYNIPGDEKELEGVKKAIIKKGAMVRFGYDEKKKEINELKLVSGPEKSEGNWSDDMTNFEDLLSAAHKNFGERFEIRTKLLEVDFDKKRALFKAQVKVWSETNPDLSQVFVAHGDATDENVSGSKIKPHFIRMAETRAIARALRWATNNAKVAEEETGGDVDGNTENQSSP